MSNEENAGGRPELIFGLVGPLGTRLTGLADHTESNLRSFGYTTIRIKVSDLLQHFQEWTPVAGDGAGERVRHLQAAANSVREHLTDGAILARAAIAEIRKIRREHTGDPDRAAPDCAFIVYQLKNPAEVALLRQTYGDAFYLIGGHACRDNRIDAFARLIAESHYDASDYKKYQKEAIDLIEIDERSDGEYGQSMRDTYPEADVFVDLNPEYGEVAIRRFIELLFGHPFHTPTPGEYAMYLASAVSLRSSDKNRQVGAVIVDIGESDHGVIGNANVLAVGMNEVPRAGGGFYWDQSSPDRRDQALGEDRAEKIKIGILTEIVERIGSAEWLGQKAVDMSSNAVAREWLSTLNKTQFMNIGEFSRPVHAEMAAIIDAARRGVSIDGCSIYVTTFPCHNCAKHIVAAGLRRVIYLEPYPKSRAEALYREELICDAPDSKPVDGRVVFCAYTGVAPRQYAKLFSMAVRGGENGPTVWEWDGSRDVRGPTCVVEHLQVGYPSAERKALGRLHGVGYDWDEAMIIPAHDD